MVDMANIDMTQLQPIIDKLQEESDRACVILGVATLDALLENLLRKSMLPNSPKELYGERGALGNFAAKIDLAYSLGLISAEERHDLHLLRKIRNDFAHAVNHELAFETPAIADRIRALCLLRLFEGSPILADANNTIRWRLHLGIGHLILVLSDFRVRAVRPPQAPEDIKPGATLKKCPKCAEEVKHEAVVCQFCGYEFKEGKAELSPG